jgi:hypothetical protein
MPAAAERIWLPAQHTNRQLDRLNRALNQYDERLRFGRNEDNGDWCVFLCLRGERPIPVLGFQDEIPEPDEMIRRVEAADTRKHGDKILIEMEEHNNRLRAEVREKADEAEWQLAEGMESFLHAQGKTPYTRIFSKAVESRRTGGQ